MSFIARALLVLVALSLGALVTSITTLATRRVEIRSSLAARSENVPRHVENTPASDAQRNRNQTHAHAHAHAHARTARVVTTTSGAPPSTIGATHSTHPQCSQGSPHYSFDPSVMPPDFRTDLEAKVRRIATNFEKRKSWRHYETADVTNCTLLTPECIFFRCIGVGAADDRPYRKCCVEHGKLRSTLHWTVALLEKANITYFLSTGTALGALRHGGTIIPWDTDVDVAIFPEDRERAETLFRSHSAEHHFNRDRLGKQMFWVHASKNGKPMDGPHVEVFSEPDYTSRRDLLLPLTSCTMYGRKVACPAVTMFEHWFGKHWRTYGGCHYHDNGRVTVYVNGRKVDKGKCDE